VSKPALASLLPLQAAVAQASRWMGHLRHCRRWISRWMSGALMTGRFSLWAKMAVIASECCTRLRRRSPPVTRLRARQWYRRCNPLLLRRGRPATSPLLLRLGRPAASPPQTRLCNLPVDHRRNHRRYLRPRLQRSPLLFRRGRPAASPLRTRLCNLPVDHRRNHRRYLRRHLRCSRVQDQLCCLALFRVCSPLQLRRFNLVADPHRRPR
jgi:hypothetical protein